MPITVDNAVFKRIKIWKEKGEEKLHLTVNGFLTPKHEYIMDDDGSLELIDKNLL